MDRKIFTIVLAIALVACFFLAFWGPASALDIVKAPLFGWEKYLLVLIPLSGLLLLLGALNNGNYIMGRSLWAWLPLLTLLFWIFIMPLLNGASFGDIFSNIGQGYGIGMWIAIAAALILAFYNPKPKAA